MAKNYAELIQGINQGIPDNNQGLVSPTDVRENMIDLADWASELPDIENVKGAYNASTNTPTLTATPDPTFNDGAYYDVTVSGAVGFAGSNFTSGTVLNVLDKLKKKGTQWYRIPFDVDSFYNVISQRYFNDVKPTVIPAGSTLGTPTSLTCHIAPAGSYTLPSGNVTLTGNINLFFWDFDNEWTYSSFDIAVKDGSVTTEKILDSAVTEQKIATESVTRRKLSNALQAILQLLDTTEVPEFNVTDEIGNVGMKLTNDGILLLDAIISRLINGVEFSSNGDYPLVVTDEYGFVSSMIDNDGNATFFQVSPKTLKFPSYSIKEESGKIIVNDITGSTVVSISLDTLVAYKQLLAVILKADDISVASTTTSLFPFTIVDENGNISYAIDQDGNKVVQNEDNPLQFDINHFIFYGQSLSLGGLATPAISTTSRFNNALMFATGAKTWEGKTETEAEKYAYFTQLIENTQETPASGFAEQLVELIQQENGLGTSDFSVLVSCPGSSNTTIANLSKGSTNYQHLLKDVENGYRLAKEQNKTYDISTICWMQGEADALNNTTYQILLRQLQKDLNEDISIILGRQKNIRIITYQTASFNAYNVGMVGNPVVAVEQYNVSHSANSPLITMSQAMYDKNYVTTDNVHLTPLSSKITGAYFAIAAKRLLVDKITSYNSIYPKNYVVQGKTLTIEFYSETALSFDTINVSNPGNFGFKLFDMSNIEQTITTVEVVRKKYVKITCANNIVSGVLKYAHNGTYPNSGPSNGTRGNLRDSSPIVFNPTGLNKNMYNWCPIFQLKIN